MVRGAMSEPASATKDRLARRGSLVLVGSSMLFGLMALLARRSNTYAPGAEVAFVRFVVGLAWVALFAIARPFRPKNLGALFSRGLFGGVAVLGFFLAIEKLSAGFATLLNYTSPVAAAFFGALFLGERLRSRSLLALALTSVGVVLVVKANAAPGSFGFGPWVLVGLASALASGAAITSIRWARRSDGSWEVFGAFCAMGALVCAGPATFLGGGWVWPPLAGWLYMIAVGTVTFAAQMLFTWALGYVNVATTGVITQLTPVSAIALGAIFSDERWTWLSVAGALVTITGVLIGARPAQEIPKMST